AGHRGGLRSRDHQHVHPQLGLRGRAEGLRGRQELFHGASAAGAGQEARVILFLGDAHRVQQGEEPRRRAWRFMSWLMEDEPNLMYTKGLGLLPSRKSLAERPEFTADPAYQGFLKSFPFSMVSPYLAYAGWGGKIDSEGVPLFQQALVGKLTAKEFLDKFAEVLTKNMT